MHGIKPVLFTLGLMVAGFGFYIAAKVNTVIDLQIGALYFSLFRPLLILTSLFAMVFGTLFFFYFVYKLIE